MIMAIRKTRSQMVMSSAEIAAVYADWGKEEAVGEQAETLEQIADRVAPQGGKQAAMKAAKARAKQAAQARMDASYAEAERIVATGVCPQCGRNLRRNLSLTGWWQCSQLGAEGFRADASQPSCTFQTFTRH
jgi:ribosomal protein L37AE/L43A